MLSKSQKRLHGLWYSSLRGPFGGSNWITPFCETILQEQGDVEEIHSWELTWKLKRGPIKTTVPLKRGYMGGCQNYGPFLGPCSNTGPNTGPNLGTQKGTIILTSPHMGFHVSLGECS